MTLQKAKQIFEQIVELCYQTENLRLIEVIDSIYSDIDHAEDSDDVAKICIEIQITINEEDFDDYAQEVVDEIQELIEQLSE
jgi:hypothetical protein